MGNECQPRVIGHCSPTDPIILRVSPKAECWMKYFELLNYDQVLQVLMYPNQCAGRKVPDELSIKIPVKWTDDHLPIWDNLDRLLTMTHTAYETRQALLSQVPRCPRMSHLAPVPCSLRVWVAPAISWYCMHCMHCTHLTWCLSSHSRSKTSEKQAPHSLTRSHSPRITTLCQTTKYIQRWQTKSKKNSWSTWKIDLPELSELTGLEDATSASVTRNIPQKGAPHLVPRGSQMFKHG